jgi:hypothetical protein
MWIKRPPITSLVKEEEFEKSSIKPGPFRFNDQSKLFSAPLQYCLVS